MRFTCWRGTTWRGVDAQGERLTETQAQTGQNRTAAWLADEGCLVQRLLASRSDGILHQANFSCHASLSRLA